MTVLSAILQSILNAPSYNKHELAAPRVILWPDKNRLWIECIEPLRASYPALWSLTVYLFADGMRMDLARSLEERLLASDLMVDIEFSYDWAAIPTITATAKPGQQAPGTYPFRWGLERT